MSISCWAHSREYDAILPVLMQLICWGISTLNNNYLPTYLFETYAMKVGIKSSNFSVFLYHVDKIYDMQIFLFIFKLEIKINIVTLLVKINSGNTCKTHQLIWVGNQIGTVYHSLCSKILPYHSFLHILYLREMTNYNQFIEWND